MPLFPERSGDFRPSTKARTLAFRAPDDIAAYVEAIVSRGYKMSEVLLQLVTIAKEATESAAGAWVEIEQYAARKGVSVGVALGQLAVVGLRQRK